MTRIERFGWRGPVEPGVARVVSSHGDYFHLVCNEAGGEIVARKKKSAFSKRVAAESECAGLRRVERSETAGAAVVPTTGDFVRFRYNAAGESMITEVLPRFSRFERKDPAARRKAQTLAVNFDALFVMMSLNEDFSVPRIERYLELAEDIGGGEAVVVVTKMDLRENGDEEFLGALDEAVAGRVRVLRISALTGEGMDGVMEYAKPGRTIALVGSSGVGKSTLLNTLFGERVAATQEIQEWSGRGRHTTTSRELTMLPSGAMVIDTPGIREIGLSGDVETVRAKGESGHRWRK